jgi:hypothetical protein
MKTATSKILFFLITLWIILSCVNIFYNAGKSISEIKEWGFLSDSQKRQKIFGDLYSFIKLVDEKTNTNARILIISNENAPYYLARYYLYPKKVYSLSESNFIQEVDKQKKIEYIVSYNKNIFLNNYKKIASFKQPASNNYGSIYIKK